VIASARAASLVMEEWHGAYTIFNYAFNTKNRKLANGTAPQSPKKSVAKARPRFYSGRPVTTPRQSQTTGPGPPSKRCGKRTAEKGQGREKKRTKLRQALRSCPLVDLGLTHFLILSAQIKHKVPGAPVLGMDSAPMQGRDDFINSLKSAKRNSF